MQVRLTFRDHLGAARIDADGNTAAAGVGVNAPDACPHAGCGGRHLRLRQTVAKAVRGDHTSHAPVVARRYTCLDCGRTFRAYPAGIDRGQVQPGVKALAAGLHLLGLGFRDTSRALTVFGVPLGKSQIQVATTAIVGGACTGNACAGDDTSVGDARAGGGTPLFTAVGFDDGDRAVPAGVNPRAWIEVDGTRRSLRRVVDARGRPMLVIDDVDVYTRRQIERWGRELLAGIGVEVEIVADTITGSWGAERARRACGEQWDAAEESSEGGGHSDEAGADGDGGPCGDGGAASDGGARCDEVSRGDAGMPVGEGLPGNAGASCEEAAQGADAFHIVDHRDRATAATTASDGSATAERIIGSRKRWPVYHRSRPKRRFAVMAPPPAPIPRPRAA